MNPACDFCYACYQHGHVEEYCPKPMNNLTDKAKKFLDDRDYFEEDFAYRPPAGYDKEMLLEHFTAFASECIEAENAEKEKLEGILSGDPNLTATKEEREAWRLSAVRYADKLEAENARLTSELSDLKGENENLREMHSALGREVEQMATSIFQQENTKLKAELSDYRALVDESTDGVLHFGDHAIYWCADARWRLDSQLTRRSIGLGPMDYTHPGYDSLLDAFKSLQAENKS